MLFTLQRAGATLCPNVNEPHMLKHEQHTLNVAWGGNPRLHEITSSLTWP